MSDSKFKTNILFFYCLSFALIMADRFSKLYIVRNFKILEQKAIIGKFLSLYYVRNTGSAFSLFADKAWGIYLLSGISLVFGILLGIFLYFSKRAGSKIFTLGISLLFAGAIGNLIDRIFERSVVDFIRCDFGSYTFPIFNVADICAVIGTIIIILILLFKPKIFDVNFFKNESKETAPTVKCNPEVIDEKKN